MQVAMDAGGLVSCVEITNAQFWCLLISYCCHQLRASWTASRQTVQVPHIHPGYAIAIQSEGSYQDKGPVQFIQKAKASASPRDGRGPRTTRKPHEGTRNQCYGQRSSN